LPVGISPTRLLAEFNPLWGRTLCTDLPSIALRHITNSHFGERPIFARRHVKNVAAGRVQPTSGKNSFCRIALNCPQAYHKPPPRERLLYIQPNSRPNPTRSREGPPGRTVLMTQPGTRRRSSMRTDIAGHSYQWVHRMWL
jgi:hypothetical protein